MCALQLRSWKRRHQVATEQERRSPARGLPPPAGSQAPGLRAALTVPSGRQGPEGAGVSTSFCVLHIFKVQPGKKQHPRMLKGLASPLGVGLGCSPRTRRAPSPHPRRLCGRAELPELCPLQRRTVLVLNGLVGGRRPCGAPAAAKRSIQGGDPSSVDVRMTAPALAATRQLHLPSGEETCSPSAQRCRRNTQTLGPGQVLGPQRSGGGAPRSRCLHLRTQRWWRSLAITAPHGK